MQRIFLTLLLLVCISCENKKKDHEQDTRQNYWKEFTKETQLKPKLNKAGFDTLSGWDFGWFLLEPINVIRDQGDHEILITKRFSPGQKALHFFWYLDAQVSSGGFSSFYSNGYGKYIPAILDGLQIIDDQKMINLVKKADQVYLENKDLFDQGLQNKKSEAGANSRLKDFDELDKEYLNINNQTMTLFEQYARENTGEFGIVQ